MNVQINAHMSHIISQCHALKHIYEADISLIQRDVAIKCFHDDQVNLMEDFMKEATTMQGLDHVCIVKLIGVSKSPLMMVRNIGYSVNRDRSVSRYQ